MLILTHASLATVDQLFKYKFENFTLPDFPGYSDDQWGIKAHNRPWIEQVGQFSKDQRVIEIGGAYSLLPKYLAEQYELEAWIADDFGEHSDESNWSRWGDPHELPKKYPILKYVFEPFGNFSSSFPDEYYDRIFSVSTLEHINTENRLDVVKDMNRCLKPGGLQLHTIDILKVDCLTSIISGIKDKAGLITKLLNFQSSEIMNWVNIFKDSGVSIQCKVPNSLLLLKRSTLLESYDVVYRYYPPNDEPKKYTPSASLLLIVKKLQN